MTSAVFLDDCADLRMLMPIMLKMKLGISCLSLQSVSELVRKLDQVLDSAVAIIDINLGPGQPSGLDAYNLLRKHRFKGKIFFLTGHASSHPLVRQALQSGVQVLEKPMSSEKLCEILRREVFSIGQEYEANSFQ